jgi:SAM-dependent methyltransferase
MSQPTQQLAYGSDLAYIHDVGYGGFAAGAAPGLLAILRRAGIHNGLVVDLGCGSGIWAAQLIEAGYDVLGVDISPAMIELARKRAPRATFHVGSWTQTILPRCWAITALGEVLGYQFDGAAAAGLPKLFRRAYSALESGGVIIFDLVEVGLDRNRPPHGRSGHDWACLVRFEYDERREQSIAHIETFRQSGDLYRRQTETHRVQLFRAAEVARTLRKIGFRVRLVRRYGDFSLLPKRIGIVARKP